ncbi:MAG: hypothetical protein JWO12_704 [Frankiales bacterium]|nr:hypothetical protein [Frankiales bacterium]
MLCHTDLRPQAPEPAVVPAQAPIAPAPTASYGPPAPDPLTQPLSEVLGEPRAEASWPCGMCQAVNPMTADVCGVCQQPFLAAMRSGEQPVLVLPVVGDIGRLSRGRRIALALGLVAVLLIPLAIITLLLTSSPPPDHVTPLPSSPAVVSTP